MTSAGRREFRCGDRLIIVSAAHCNELRRTNKGLAKLASIEDQTQCCNPNALVLYEDGGLVMYHPYVDMDTDTVLQAADGH